MDRRVLVAAAPVGHAPLHQPLEVAITRRRLILAGSATAAALALGDLASLAAHVGAARAPGGLRRSDYQPYVGRSFRLSVAGAGTLSIPLVSVEDLSGPRGLAGSEHAFILIFHAPAGSPRLGQALMTVRHPRGWSRRLLVSPASPGHDGLDYAAVINRAKPN
ncbi:MAG: DUF6916 family protein [Solirubrobacteraceae bacterium]